MTTRTLPVAYELVRPVLERANAKQLDKIESYSPVSLYNYIKKKVILFINIFFFLKDFVQYSDDLWRNLCLKEFKESEPNEDEAWRELYFVSLQDIR